MESFFDHSGWHPQTGLKVQLAIYVSGSGVSSDRTGKDACSTIKKDGLPLRGKPILLLGE